MTKLFDGARRDLIKATAGASFTLAGAMALPAALRAKDSNKKDSDKTHGKKPDKDDAEVTPPEDLMREHGVLDRLLLVYEAGMQKFAAKQDFDPALLGSAAGIVRDFIENYHEQSEEEAVFPRFKKAGKMVALVDTLLAQHKAGRRVTEVILKTAPGSRADGDDRRQLIGAMQAFIRMYRPHAAREDTDLFPMLRQLVSAHEFGAMAEDFERKEHKLFGTDGFEIMVMRVADLERAVGIADLAQFTPE
jgi:hemerythrin-like domain-containing protein